MMHVEVAVFLSLLGVALVSMVPYALGPGRAGVSPDGSARKGSFVLGRWLRDWFYWAIHPVKGWAVRAGWNPDTFNYLGVAFSLASMALYAVGDLGAAGWMLLLGGIADVLDGEVARGRGIDSPYGAFLDSTLDRFAEVFVFIGLAAFYAETRTATVLIAAGLGGSLLVSYTRARGESVGVVCKAGVMQRAERMLALGFGSIFDPTLSEKWGREPGSVLIYILWVVAIASIGTAIYRTIWISRELRRTR
jgi:CDP-diacylglycerol--glycerol-3-phosphate 3-phosphatidyltransferase